MTFEIHPNDRCEGIIYTILGELLMNIQVRSHDEYLIFITIQMESLSLTDFVKDFYLDITAWISLIDLTAFST